MKSVVVAAAVLGTVLVSGLVDVNIEHHLNLPTELTNKNTITTSGHFARVIDIRLSDEIKGEDSVKDIVKTLQEADSNDTVVFHIAGYGGNVDTVLLLINNIQNTKAHTKMIVEAPSFSGHAYLAASGDELTILPYAYVMFHTSSAYGLDCSTKEGTDRTVPNSEHCAVLLKYHMFEVEKYIDSISFLTDEEKTAIKTGHDVIITSEVYNERVK